MSDKEKELNKKEAGVRGSLIASAIFTVIMLIMFAWPPISFLSSKWSNYWDKKEAIDSYSTVTTRNDSEEDMKRRKAYDDCENRTEKYFNSPEVTAYASTTNKYETYTCYGINWEEIPNE